MRLDCLLTNIDLSQFIQYFVSSFGFLSVPFPGTMPKLLIELSCLNISSSNTFTEDDWKLVQLVLTLFRNILAIHDITQQQKSAGLATQYFCLADRFLELMFEENVMDLIIVLTQHVNDSSGYLQQDNLLLLEIFNCIFLGRDPELIARVSKQANKVYFVLCRLFYIICFFLAMFSFLHLGPLVGRRSFH